eukprot:scaffold119266_cov69-Phaeocystis_antarctica.AAC.1
MACAYSWPFAAASPHSRLASAKSFGPPWPSKCILPSMPCASVWPCAAASPHSRLASPKSWGPPSPLALQRAHTAASPRQTLAVPPSAPRSQPPAPRSPPLTPQLRPRSCFECCRSCRTRRAAACEGAEAWHGADSVDGRRRCVLRTVARDACARARSGGAHGAAESCLTYASSWAASAWIETRSLGG